MVQAGVQQFGDQFVFRTAFVSGKGGQGDLQAFTDFDVVGARAGRGPLAYQVQETVPDRHMGGLYQNMCSSVKQKRCLSDSIG